MPKYRVLSLDGGGVRGLLTTMILERLCRQPGLEHAFDRVDLIAGNSSGALIALAMAHGLGQPAMLGTIVGTRMAFEAGRKVFGPCRVPIPILDAVVWLFLSKYRNRAREMAVKKLLQPQTRLRDLKTHVLITSFDLDSERENGVRLWKPKIFHNFIGPNTDRDIFAWKAALYSTSAITYFPSVDGFIDGGIYANNPSMCALAQIYDERYWPKPKPELDDVLMFSVGAGQNLFSMKSKTVRAGLLPWIWKGRFVSLTTDAMVGVADYECRQMLSDSNYKRINPDFGTHAPITLDDFNSIEFIKQLLDKPEVVAQIDECAEWLREHWMAGMTSGPILPETTSKHVGMATELTCLMPIKPGFVPVLDTRTYATRLRAVFKVLQGLRVVSREQRTLKPVLDIVEAARTVHSFSWAIVAERNLLLQVTFDRPWEPYIRVVWKDLGPLLDLFLCNCEGFVPSAEGFEPFAAFVRRHQVEANFFYPSSSSSVDDGEYLVQLEKMQRDDPRPHDNRAATFIAAGPVAQTKKAIVADPDDAARQWLAVLDVLYGLRSLYPDGSTDHVYLQLGTRALLTPSRPKTKLPSSPALDWFDSKGAGVGAAQYERRRLDPAQVQGGIQKPYRRITHGCLLLARVEDAGKARAFVGEMAGEVTRGSGHPDRGADARDDDVYVNLAFTFSGLKQLGVNDSILARFPKEFREGMDARAGLLGDIRQNHPEKWELPAWNSSCPGHGHSEPAKHAPVRMSTVDVVMTLNLVGGQGAAHALTPEHPLYSEVEKWCGELHRHGLQVLSLEPLRRMRPTSSNSPQNTTRSRDHFGFLDGISQPNASDVPKEFDDVELGELFVGFQNQRGDPPFPETSDDPSAWVRGSLIDAGSFLVVRKLRQYVGALNEVLDKSKNSVASDRERILAKEHLRAKMVGRSRDGVPLVNPPPGDNHFDFQHDLEGATCPFHAHIRRGNPRLPKADASQPLVPRFARRSLAYGPDVDADKANKTDDAHDRGVMFMAYNASIAEQFEILQRWMSSGNTPAGGGNTGVFSGQPDPLLGLPDTDGRRTYRFLDDAGKLCHVDLGPQPFVTLRWGLYLFAPSIPALKILSQDPTPDIDEGLAVVSLGEQVISKLTTLEDWAAAIEDGSMNLSGATAAVFAAIRKAHNGVLRTKYGVLVASRDLAMQVLSSDPLFSVCEYQRRFAASVGESYLGMDRGSAYEAISNRSNDTLSCIKKEHAFNEAHARMARELQRAKRVVIETEDRVPPGRSPDPWVSIPLEPVVDYVLGKLAQDWFDIPDGRLIKLGGQPAPDSEDVHCPFSFLAPSRYVFSSPNPRDTVTALGQGNGQRLLDKARLFVKQCRELEKVTGNTGLKGDVSRALFDAIRDDDDLLARTLLGLVFGFVPTVYGNALTVLGVWLGDNSLWRVQQRLLSAASDGPHMAAESIRKDIERAMLTRPVPPLLHRTVTASTTLGGVALTRGDRVVVGMWGVTQDIVEHGELDVMPIFGGNRNADNHPTHACPGYDIAMGVLLGLLTAVLELGPLAPAPALVTIRVPRNPES